MKKNKSLFNRQILVEWQKSQEMSPATIVRHLHSKSNGKLSISHITWINWRDGVTLDPQFSQICQLAYIIGVHIDDFYLGEKI
jgi:hypothetical protein